MIRCKERTPISWLRFSVVASSVILLFCSSSINLARSFSCIEESSQQDSRIATAQQIFAEGQQLLGEGTAVSQRQAIEKFAKASKIWHAIGDKRGEAIALSFIGKVYDL